MFSENEDYIPHIPKKREKITMPRGVLEDPSVLMEPHLWRINLDGLKHFLWPLHDAQEELKESN